MANYSNEIYGIGGGDMHERKTYHTVSENEKIDFQLRVELFEVLKIYKDGTKIEFKDQNKVDLISYNASSEYKVDGNKLSFKDAQTGQWSADYFEYEIDSEQMTWSFPGITLNLEKQ